MIEVKLLAPGELHLLRTAVDVFDDPVVDASALEFLNDPRHKLVAALDGGTVVGFVSAVVYIHPDKPAPELWINEVGVADSHQRQGIGRRLMQRMLEVAKEAGCTEAWVLTEQENLAANALYQSMGGEAEKPNPVLYAFELD